MTHRVVFLGSPAFAFPSLEALDNDERFDVVLVVSQPDRPVGRGRMLTPPPIATLASDRDIDIFQPDTLRDDEAVRRISEHHPDLLVVVAYGEILNKRMLQLATAGAVNVHPSLLPAHRGSSPIQTAILNGDAVTGVSIMKLVRRLDAGPVLAQRQEQIQPDDTSGSLGERLASIAGDMLPDVSAAWLSGAISPVDQDEQLATYTREWSKRDAQIDWNRPAIEIERLMRASDPWPIAWTTFAGDRIQIRSARVRSDVPVAGPAVGAVVEVDGAPLVQTGTGLLELLVVQPAGKRAIPARDWYRNAASNAAALYFT